MKKLSLTLKERLILQNQYLILEKLYPAGGYAEKRKIVENGYTNNYKELFDSIETDELSIKKCKFVLDVLNMYKAIISSNSNLEESAIPNVYFKGFDGNNEVELMQYVQFNIVDLNMYNEIRQVSGETFNSHCPMSDKYKQMLSKWNTFKDKYSITKEELEELLNIAN